jgi:DNA helicase II / ATP-dependent DNA helicase PcrA
MKKNQFYRRYEHLNENQRLAVDNIDGPLIVVAGPGSGKTELLALRTAQIIRKTDLPASSVLCITFTNSATLNMRERLLGLIGAEAHKVSIYTFHGFCLELTERFKEHFSNEEKMIVADDFVKLQIIEKILGSLEFDDPLKKLNREGGFLYLKDVERSIFYLQEAGVTPKELQDKLKENERELKIINKIIDKYLSERVSKNTILTLEAFLSDKEYNLSSLSDAILKSLSRAVSTGETKNISKWKQDMTRRIEGKLVVKETTQIEKLKSLSLVYKKYMEEIKNSGYYTFSDMILNVIDVLSENEDLRKEIQEKYQYIQVDEFQDTNGAQMKLLELLTSDAPEDEPNICVVGDDDQAIYQFQGADISNILNFREKYKDIKKIVLLKNYRSNQEIVDKSKEVILNAEERLEGKYEDIDKNLVAEKKRGGGVTFSSFITKDEEISFIVEEIKRKIEKEEVKPKDIAVISRTHQEIKDLLPYFINSKVPFLAEKKENVLEKESVKEIINIIKFSFYLFKKDDVNADFLLPEILTYPFFQIERKKIWEVAKRSYQERLSWVDCILKDDSLSEIGEFFLEIASLLEKDAIEEALSLIIGSKKTNYSFNFKKFYFEDKLEKKEGYLSFLFSIKSFLIAIRKHYDKKIIKKEDLINFINFYEKNNLSILERGVPAFKEDAVSLITAHSAKGREFEIVFINNCYQESWGKERGYSKINFPLNMPIERAGNRRDERVRLFYVAMTRAKKDLYLTTHQEKSENRGSVLLDFLPDIKKEEKKQKIRIDALEKSLLGEKENIFSSSEKETLLSLIKDYKLSATGFNKFLNIVNGGPKMFFEDHILRFPQQKTIYSSYGTAFHGLIKEIYYILNKKDHIVSEKEAFQIFKEIIQKERLPEKDYFEALKKGKKEVSYFYKNKIADFKKEDIIEKDFKNEGCAVENVPISGKIDKMRIRSAFIDVFDYKTGEAILTLNEKEERKKIRGWQYKNQLIFYKLLIENSRDFSKYKVDCGFLDFVSTKENNLLEVKIEKEDTERVKKLIKIISKKISNIDFVSIDKYQRKTLKDIRKFESDLLEEKI